MFHCLRLGTILLVTQLQHLEILPTTKNKNKQAKIQLIASYLSNLVASKLSPVADHHKAYVSTFENAKSGDCLLANSIAGKFRPPDLPSVSTA